MNTEALRENSQDHNLDEIDGMESALSAVDGRLSENISTPKDDLVRGLKAGENESFKELQRLYYQRLYTIAMKELWNKEDAEDVLQQAFLKVFKYIKSFEDGGNFTFWMYAIVRNLCKDVLRKRMRRNEVSWPEQENVIADERMLFNPRPFEDAPDVCLMRRRTMCKLAEVVDSLFPELKQALLMYHLEGRTYKEMSERMGAPGGTVNSRLFRARQQVCLAMSEYL
jgi:RNA polymerase sigma-70 factor (ECF subfamily)